MKVITTLIGVSFVVAVGVIGMSPGNAYAKDKTAFAEIKGCTDPNITGTAFLVERSSREGIKQVDVAMVVRGLKDGKHAVHIHETATCKPCKAAKGHHDPGPFS